MAASTTSVLTRTASTLHRSLSTSAARGALVKPPLQLFGYDGRYAMALYSAASKQKVLDKVEGDMKAVQKLYQNDKKLREFILDPTYKRVTKRDGMKVILKKLGHNDVTINFFETVAENGRMPKFMAIARAFDQLMSAHRGEIVCEVTTAKPVDGSMTKEIESALQPFQKSGQKLQITYKVNPAILGGMTVRVGDRYADMSLIRKVNMYEKLLRDAL